MTRKLLVATAMLVLAACTVPQLDRADAVRMQVANACGVLSVVAPGTWAEPWVVGCRTADGIAALALKPEIHAWLRGIIDRLR